MNLAELIDLENQFLKDSDADPVEIRKRDRKIGRELEKRGSTRSELFLAWLKRVRTDESNSPGQMLETGKRWFGIILSMVGLILGGSTAAAVLSFDGSSPVNVVHFLAVIVGFQLLTILFFMINALPNSIKKMIPGAGEFYNFIGELTYLSSRLAGKIFSHLPANRLSGILTDLKQLKIKQKLYSGLEKWIVVGLTQRFSLAFNIGALATCLYLISFSDLAFAWNTTLQISAATFHKIIGIIAIPWASFFPDAVPSLELVEVSRYFRLNAEYLGTRNSATIPHAAIVGRWWLFLVFSLIFYGLLPRFVILSFAKIKLKISLNKLPLKSADFESLYDRLTRPLVETGAINTTDKIHESIYFTAAEFKANNKNKICTIIKWGDLDIADSDIQKLIDLRFGWKISDNFSAGGFDYNSSDAATYKSIKEQKETQPILILAESWEAPTAIIYFLQQLREVTRADRQIIIGMINVDAEKNWKPPLPSDLRSWKEEITRLADPYLWVVSMMEDE